MEIDFSDFADPKNNNLEIKNPPQNVDGLVLQKKLRKSTFSNINDPNQKIELLRQSGQSGFLPLNKQLSELKNEEKNFHVRNEILLAQGQLAGDEVVDELINLLFSNIDLEIKKKIIAILASTRPNKEIIEALETILFWHLENELKLSALDALEKLHSQISIFSLEKLYLEDNNLQVKSKIIKLLAKIDPAEAAEFLEKQFNLQLEPEILNEYVDYFVQNEKYGQIKKLLEEFNNLPEIIQKNLIWSMAAARKNQYDLELIKFLLTQELVEEILFEAVLAFNSFKVDQSLPFLLKLLKGTNRSLQLQAILAISNLRNPKAIPHLRKRLKKELNPEIRDELKKTLHFLVIFS